MSNARLIGTGLILVAAASLLAGCATKEETVSDPTWQDAKRQTQATELEIATLIPNDQVEAVNQLPEGTLLSCDEKRHQWAGFTNVVLAAGANEAEIVESIIEHFKDDGAYTVEEFTTAGDRQNVQLIAKNGEESYIVGPGTAEGSIEIASGSVCFTLPEGTYPGGKF